MRRRIQFAVAACVMCGVQLAACAAAVSLTLKSVESGPQSGVAERSFRVVVDQRTFRELYASVHGLRISPPRPPEIDFESHVVLLAFLGTRSTGGYRIGFGEVVVAEDVARVAVMEQSPPDGVVLTQAMTTPYAMATLTRGNVKAVELVDRTGAVVFRASLRPRLATSASGLPAAKWVIHCPCRSVRTPRRILGRLKAHSSTDSPSNYSKVVLT